MVVVGLRQLGPDSRSKLALGYIVVCTDEAGVTSK